MNTIRGLKREAAERRASCQGDRLMQREADAAWAEAADKQQARLEYARLFGDA